MVTFEVPPGRQVQKVEKVTQEEIEAVPTGMEVPTWERWIAEGRVASARELSARLGRSKNYVAKTIHRARFGRER